MLLRFLVQNNEREFFTVCLYTCYEHIRPDTVVELSWVYGLHDFAMPFFVQMTRDLSSRVDTVHKKTEEREKKEEKQAEQASTSVDIGADFFPGIMGMGLTMPGMNQLMPPMDAFGSGMGMMGSMMGGGMGFPGGMSGYPS